MPLWGNTDVNGSKPKWVNLSNYPAGTSLVLVDRNEAQLSENKEKGLNTPGWWLYRQWTNADGGVQRYAECLVAFSSSVTAVKAGDNNTDDTVVVDFGITTQPAAKSGAVGSTQTFTVVPTTTTNVSYKWQISTGGAYADVVAGAHYTGVTTATLSVVTLVSGDNNNLFRCVLTQTNGGTVTSKSARLTVV